MTLPTIKQIEKYKESQSWSFTNEILYKMCQQNPRHDELDVIIGKVIIIGRTYAAAVERRKNKGKSNGNGDDFYIKTVAPAIKNSSLDKYLDDLKKLKSLNIDNLQQVLEAHYYLTNILFKITDMNKRSFASKYLHFHLPNLFFIFDSRVVKALSDFSSKVPSGLQYLTNLKGVDTEYAKFFCKCFDLKTKIEEQTNILLSNRQLDNILIGIANKKTE